MSSRLSKSSILILALGIYASGCGDSGEAIDNGANPGAGTSPAPGAVNPTGTATGSVGTGTPTGSIGTGASSGSTGASSGSTGTSSGSSGSSSGSTGTKPGSGSTGSITPVGGSSGSASGSSSGTGSGSTADGDGGTTTTDGPSAPNGGATTGGTGTVTGGGKCLDGITTYTGKGPFKYSAKPQGAIKFWVPEVPAGCKVPVVHLANGTGASCSNYQDVLNQLASFGFLTACYEDANTGAGTQGLKAFETAFEKFPDLADYRLGSMGHSQGGQAAFTVLALTEQKFGDKAIYSGLAMQPASGFGTQPAGGSWQSWYKKIKSPMFMFSGTADVLVSEGWVQQAFSALDPAEEAYWYSGVGSTHIPTPQEHTVTVAVSWFRWKLLGDKGACEYFKKLPDGDKWDKRKAKNEKPCQ